MCRRGQSSGSSNVGLLKYQVNASIMNTNPKGFNRYFYPRVIEKFSININDQDIQLNSDFGDLEIQLSPTLLTLKITSINVEFSNSKVGGLTCTFVYDIDQENSFKIRSDDLSTFLSFLEANTTNDELSSIIYDEVLNDYLTNTLSLDTNIECYYQIKTTLIDE